VDLPVVDLQRIQKEWLTDKELSLDILRLDLVHPVVSGNKWFKLQFYLDEANRLHKSTVATFGGAWSNHVVATACAARIAGLQSIGIIRGEKPAVLSETLRVALQFGMQLHFVSRTEYRSKEEIIERYSHDSWYWINEGGYGSIGANGAAEILKTADTSSYSHVVAAVGTGTMVAGLVLGSSDQKIIGISSMKGNYAIEKRIADLLPSNKSNAHYEINHDYHFGGYGKHPKELMHFINEVYQLHDLPLDIVYTGKTFYAIQDLAAKNFFPKGSKILMIHSGGLQGNKSLPPQVLAF
jgi:1-aminocyclopropane-1-carboxylate deaminase